MSWEGFCFHFLSAGILKEEDEKQGEKVFHLGVKIIVYHHNANQFTPQLAMTGWIVGWIAIHHYNPAGHCNFLSLSLILSLLFLLLRPGFTRFL